MFNVAHPRECLIQIDLGFCIKAQLLFNHHNISVLILELNCLLGLLTIDLKARVNFPMYTSIRTELLISQTINDLEYNFQCYREHWWYLGFSLVTCQGHLCVWVGTLLLNPTLRFDHHLVGKKTQGMFPSRVVPNKIIYTIHIESKQYQVL